MAGPATTAMSEACLQHQTTLIRFVGVVRGCVGDFGAVDYYSSYEPYSGLIQPSVQAARDLHVLSPAKASKHTRHGIYYGGAE